MFVLYPLMCGGLIVVTIIVAHAFQFLLHAPFTLLLHFFGGEEYKIDKW